MQIGNRVVGRNDGGLSAFVEGLPARNLHLAPGATADGGRAGRPDDTTVVPGPAREGVADVASLVGRTVSHYRILSAIGEGGMGIVYRARDLRLARDVALKVLPPELVADPAEKARLVHEAQAAAALEHPHIAVVHDVDEADGLSFIVMEYVQGECLSSLLARGPMKVGSTLALAGQIADALAFAHARGTVHRDLKPANVMITPSGHAKIIDFGLARLVGPPVGREDRDDNGQPGIVGTVAYMSPEQARGQQPDPRSDLFSFGVLLFELLTGRRPFDRQTGADTFAAIVRDPAPALPPIEHVPGEVHEGLGRILQRCLAKSIESRYQQAGELRADLTAVRRSLDSPAVAIREVLRRQWPPSPRFAAILAGSLCALIALSIWLGPTVLRRVARTPVEAGRTGAPAAMAAWTPRQVTSFPGWEREPAISPDGSLVAYVAGEGGRPDIWVSDVQGRQPVRLTDDAALDEEPAWMPDGSAVVFVSERGGRKDVWRVPRAGGRAMLILPNATDPDVSPDGTRIAFARRAANGFLRIAVAPLSDPGRATTLTGDGDGLWDHKDPVWSPDGRRLSYAAGRGLWIVGADGARARVITPGEADGEPAWAPDGRHVYFAAERDGAVALWRVDTTNGRTERLTTGTGAEVHPSVARHASRMAYATLREESDIVVHDLETGALHRLESARGEVMPTIAPDAAAVVFMSDRPGGDWGLWRQRLVNGVPSGAAARFFEQTSVSHPRYSPDGRWVAYYGIVEDHSGRTQGSRDIWVAPAAGGPGHRLTDDPADEVHPAWSPDGSAIAFISTRDGGYQAWSQPVADGRPAGPARRLTAVTGSVHAISLVEDGTGLAFVTTDGRGADVWITATSGHDPARRLTTGARAERLVWDRATRTLLVSGRWEGTWISLKRLDPATGALAPVPHVRMGELPSVLVDFDVSHDGRFLTYAAGTPRGDVWVLEPRQAPR